jgi:predicted O-linked N-acetylglucosamine transferase (SPINDLY family)
LHLAIPVFKQALEIDPACEEALSGLGNAAFKIGDLEESARAFEQAARIKPEKMLLKWRSDIACPVIFQDRDHIAAVRARISKNLEQYEAADFAFNVEELTYTGCQPSFYLAYNGLNDLPLKTQYGDIFWRLFNRRFPQLVEKPSHHRWADGRIRVGFLVTEKHEGVFCKLNLGYLNHLDRTRFDVTVICPEKSREMLKARVQHPDTHFVAMPLGFEQTIHAVKALHLDVLIYYEVGTDGHNYFLPYFNLAPIQCTSYGFPVTTGIPTMDYFISSQQVEPNNAQSEYREQLIRLALDPIYFYRPVITESFKSREEMGLEAGKTYYFCPQNRFKFHPDFDEIVLNLLANDPHGEVLLIQTLYATWEEVYLQRLQRHPIAQANPALLERLRVMPRQVHHGYLNLIQCSDVILDTVHYTGGTTSFEALALGKPIVTWPQQSTRSRQTYGNYHTMQVMDCVVDSAEAYIQQALKLGTDPDYRHGIEAKIRSHHDVIFENMTVIREMERFLEAAVQQSRTGGGRVNESLL